jgi:hypothetical protein
MEKQKGDGFGINNKFDFLYVIKLNDTYLLSLHISRYLEETAVSGSIQYHFQNVGVTQIKRPIKSFNELLFLEFQN